MKTSLPLALTLAFVASATFSAQTPRPAAPQPAPQAPQTRPAPPVPGPATAAPQTPPASGVTPPSDYTIGADDVLEVIVWREKDLSAEVKVRPDGKVSLPLVNDIQAGGLTPEVFRAAVTTAVTKFVEAPSVTVIVKQINSRQVYVMGEVVKPGTYPLTAPTSVLQILAQAGGPTPYAKKDEIGVMRTVDGKTTRHQFNYNDVIRGRRIEQNIMLRPGDTVIIP